MDSEEQAEKKVAMVSTTETSETEACEGIMEKVSLRERLHHFTFAWYTLTLVDHLVFELTAVNPFR